LIWGHGSSRFLALPRVVGLWGPSVLRLTAVFVCFRWNFFVDFWKLAMKIGVVGSGISGLTAAYLLCNAGHEVHLFEKADRLGMDAHSVDVDIGDNKKIRVDMPLRVRVGLALGLVFAQPVAGSELQSVVRIEKQNTAGLH
jgi:putative NAD(P)-binding protein